MGFNSTFKGLIQASHDYIFFIFHQSFQVDARVSFLLWPHSLCFCHNSDIPQTIRSNSTIWL